jgi:hypothetical protein
LEFQSVVEPIDWVDSAVSPPLAGSNAVSL